MTYSICICNDHELSNVKWTYYRPINWIWRVFFGGGGYFIFFLSLLFWFVLFRFVCCCCFFSVSIYLSFHRQVVTCTIEPIFHPVLDNKCILSITKDENTILRLSKHDCRLGLMFFLTSKLICFLSVLERQYSVYAPFEVILWDSSTRSHRIHQAEHNDCFTVWFVN